MMQQMAQTTYQNRSAKIVIWLAVTCYALTIFLPIITLNLFIFYADAMIFDVLSEAGVVIFFLGLGSAVVAGIFIKNPILFRLAAISSTGLAIFPLYAILDQSGGFVQLNVGFYTYAGGAILSLIAGIIYRHQARLQRRAFQKLQQPIQTAQQMYVQYPGQKLQPTYQQHQPTEKPVKTLYCSNCGIKVSEKDEICQECGNDLTE